jgi:hypothetical protein
MRAYYVVNFQLVYLVNLLIIFSKGLITTLIIFLASIVQVQAIPVN